MQDLWQDLAAVALIAAAVVYVARRLWQMAHGRSRGGCNTCRQCPKIESQPRLISLDPPSDDCRAKASLTAKKKVPPLA